MKTSCVLILRLWWIFGVYIYTTTCSDNPDGSGSGGDAIPYGDAIRRQFIISTCPLNVEICFNGGTCYVENGLYACDCAPGWHGLQCKYPHPFLPKIPADSTNPPAVATTTTQTTTLKIVELEEPEYCKPNPCQFGGRCSIHEGEYRCECLDGYFGERCQFPWWTATDVATNLVESTRPPQLGSSASSTTSLIAETSADQSRPDADACQPNPCHNDCECVPSCKHELGYYCYGTDGHIGKNCSIEIPVVVCGESEITVSVSSQFYEQYDAGVNNSYFYLSPHADLPTGYPSDCTTATRQTDGRYKLSLSLPFDACGTAITFENDGVVFSNVLWANRDLGSALIDMPVAVVRFRCTYGRDYSLVTSLNPTIHQHVPVLEREGSFDVEMGLCKVASCPRPCPAYYAVRDRALYTIGQRIHLQVRAAVQNNNDVSDLVATASEVFLSCSPNSSYPQRKLYLARHGCPMKQSGAGVKMSSGRAANSICFSFLVPRFDCDLAYIHARIRICASTGVRSCEDDNAVVHCNDHREKRSIFENVIQPYSVIGPISFISGSAGSRFVQLYPEDGAKEITYFRADDFSGKPNVKPDITAVVLYTVVASALVFILYSAFNFAEFCTNS